MKKIVIIGNGPSALQRKSGSQIDAADVVVRINDFKTAGFEKCVGTKTDILFTCRLNEYLENLHIFPEVILSLLMNPLEGVTIPEELIAAPNISERIDWPEVESMKLGLAVNCYPSTGLLCVLKMVRRFGHVHVTGFDHFATGNRHYYGKENGMVPVRHDGEGEKLIFDVLRSLGLLSVGF